MKVKTIGKNIVVEGKTLVFMEERGDSDVYEYVLVADLNKDNVAALKKMVGAESRVYVTKEMAAEFAQDLIGLNLTTLEHKKEVPVAGRFVKPFKYGKNNAAHEIGYRFLVNCCSVFDELAFVPHAEHLNEHAEDIGTTKVVIVASAINDASRGILSRMNVKKTISLSEAIDQELEV